MVLGVDNIVFIAITTNRLPESKQHIGRKLGLAGALIMRVLFLSFASYLVHMTAPLFTIDLGSWAHGFSVRDLVMFCGGSYLIYKGISEVKSTLALTEERAKEDKKVHEQAHTMTLPQAVATIMVMDLVFSIDSVITAVGLAEHLIVMIIAVIAAICLMMALIDQISDFINKHAEMKILAITFITVIGFLLALDGLGINSGVEVLDMHAEKLMVYFAMVFAFILELIQMRYDKNYNEYMRNRWAESTKNQVEKLREDMEKSFKKQARARERYERKSRRRTDLVPSRAKLVTPVYIGGQMFVIMPMTNEEENNFKKFMGNDPQYSEIMNETKHVEEIEAEVEDIDPTKEDTKTNTSEN